MKTQLGIPTSIREAGVQEADFLAKVDKLAEDAFDDQCTGANPRYPLIAELKQIMLDTFYGREYAEPFDSVSEAISAQPVQQTKVEKLSLIHISEPTRQVR